MAHLLCRDPPASQGRRETVHLLGRHLPVGPGDLDQGPHELPLPLLHSGLFALWTGLSFAAGADGMPARHTGERRDRKPNRLF